MDTNLNTLLAQLQGYTESVFDDKLLTEDMLVSDMGKAVISEVKNKGFALRKELGDKQARPVFVTIQASAERKAVEAMPTGLADDKINREVYVKLQTQTEKTMVDKLKTENENLKSIWIIHTPAIATPCVTEGEPTPKLLANEIMEDQVRKKVTLSRVSIIRDYLKAGGLLIIAYDKNNQSRTEVQLGVYQKLMNEYPKQIIDFPMSGLNGYPDDLIGATYLIEDTFKNVFEMSNRGVQANDVRDDATWGVWMQNRSQPVKEVNEQMEKVFSLLQKADFKQVLENHMLKQNINFEDYAPLLNQYMNVGVNEKKQALAF